MSLREVDTLAMTERAADTRTPSAPEELLRRHYRWRRDIVAPHLGARVLEVGCGAGWMLEQLGQPATASGAGEPAVRVLGVDCDAERVAEARRRIDGLAGVEARRLDICAPESLALRADGWTGALFDTSLETITEDRLAIFRAAALLRPGGTIAVLEWAAGAPRPLPRPDDAVHAYRPAGLRALLAGAGLTDVSVRWVHLTVIGSRADSRSALRFRSSEGLRMFGGQELLMPVTRLVDALTGPGQGSFMLALGTKA